MRVQVISEVNKIMFQEEMNKEISAILDNDWEIKEIKFSTCCENIDSVVYTALIIFEME
jgi:hypothetical protein